VLGGVFLMYLPQAQADHPGIAGLLFVLLGLGAVLLARDPNGLANKLFQLPRWAQRTAHPFLARDAATCEGVERDAVAAR
jgi:branched-chain amino acid transport system permease protein